ncbi:MAG: tetratricopeptide repeat protein [Fibrobacterota bacterium]
MRNITRGAAFFLLFLLLMHVSAEEGSSYLNFGNRFYNDSLYDQAVEQYNRYLNQGGDLADEDMVLYRTAHIYASRGNYSTALELYSRLREEHSSSVYYRDALYEMAEIYRDQGDYRRAAREYERVANQFSGSVRGRESVYYLAYCLKQAGVQDKAREYYQRFLRDHPGDNLAGPAMSSLVDLLIESKEYGEAKAVIDNFENYDHPDQWRQERRAKQAYIYHVTQYEDSALTLYRQVFQEYDDSFPEEFRGLKTYARLLLGNDDISQDDAALIREVMGDILTRDKRTGDMYTLFGEILLQGEYVEEGVGFLQRGLETAEKIDSGQVYYSIARAYARAGSDLQSIEILKKITPQHHEYYETAQLRIARRYVQSGLYRKAIDYYRRYMSIPGAEHPDRAVFAVARIYRDDLHASTAAIRAYDELLRDYPESPLAQNALWEKARIQENRGQYEQARATYNYLYSVFPDADLSSKAQKRARYLSEYKIVDTENALYALSEELFSAGKTEERILHGARVYSSYLKRFDEALDIIRDFLEDQPPQPYREEARFIEAEIWSDIYHKMTFEESEHSARTAKNRAVEIYSQLVEDATEDISQKAACNKVLLEDTLPSYAEYLDTHSQSPYYVDVLMAAAQKHLADHGDQTVTENDRERAFEYYSAAWEKGDKEQKTESGLYLAQWYINRGKYESAQLFLDRLEELDVSVENRYTLWRYRGEIAFEQGDYSQAGQLFLKILDNAPHHARALHARLLYAESLFRQGETEESLRNFSLAFHGFPRGKEQAQALVGMARAYTDQGSLQEARDLLSTYIDDVSDIRATYPRVVFRYARVLDLLDENYEAVKYYQQVLSGDVSKDLEYTARRYLAGLLYDLEEYQRAYGMYDILLENSVPAEDSLFFEARYLASAIMSEGTDAVSDRYSDFRRGDGADNTNLFAEVVFAEAMREYREENYRKAKRRFDYVENRLDKNDFAHRAVYYKGLLLYDQDEHSETIEHMKDFIENYPASDMRFLARFTIASSFMKQEEYVRAADNFTEVSRADEADDDLVFRSLMNGAMAWQRASSWENAGELYSRILEEYPEHIDFVDFATTTGFAWFQAGRVSRALEYFEKAQSAAEDRNIAEIDYWIAQSHKELGNTARALELYLKIPYQYGYEGKWGVTAEFQSARIYHQREQYDRAKRLYENVVRVEGTSSGIGADARDALAAIQTMEGDE